MQGELSISETADLLGFSHTMVTVCREWCEKQKPSSEQQFCGLKQVFNGRSLRRRARLVIADRKVTVTQEQKSISEHTMLACGDID